MTWDSTLDRARMEILYRPIHQLFDNSATKNRGHFPEPDPEPGARS